MSPTIPTPDVSVPWESPVVRVLVVSMVLAPLSVALVSPGLPAFRGAYGLTVPEASLLLSAILAPGIVLSPLVGLATDRVGPRRVLVASLLTWSVAGSAIALGPSYWGVVALRVIQGMALAGIAITTVTLVGTTFEGPQRNAVLGASTAVLSAAAAVYPIVGGTLIVLAWNVPFLAYALGAPAALFTYYALEESEPESDGRSLAYFRRMLSALSARDAAMLYGSAFALEAFLFGAVFTTLPFLLAESYGLSAVAIGLVVTAEALGSTIAATQNVRIVQRVPDGRIIAIGFAILGVGFAAAWLAASPASLAVATFVFGAGWGLSIPSVDAAVTDLVPPRFRGGALSLRNSASFLGRATGPVLFAALAVDRGYQELFLPAGAAALAIALVLAVVTATTEFGDAGSRVES